MKLIKNQSKIYSLDFILVFIFFKNENIVII